MEQFKNQLFTWGMITSEFSTVVCSFLFMQGLSLFEKYIMKEKKPYRKVTNVVNTDEPKTASIEFHYYTNNEDVLIESILEYICKQDTTTFLRYSNNYKPSNKKKFYVKGSEGCDDILCQILNVDYSTDGKVMSFQFEIYSNSLKLSDLHEWIDKIRKEYELEKKNQLGNGKYFFKEMVTPPMKDNQGNWVWNTAHRELKFTMTKFSTNKHLSNIFGESIQKIKDRVDLFTEHPEWYEQRGIPHTLGLLLHGPPGTGKSSCIKAIAKDTNKHIIQVSLAEYTTQDQLNNLFFTENIEVVADGRSHFYKIPLNERLYVFEDIDCLTSLVNRDTVKQTPVRTMEDAMMMPPMPMQTRNRPEKNGKAINLNYLLNLLDGILETPDRLLIMTTNKPEVLDSALIRPGRIDLNIEFGNLSSKELKRMFDFYYKTPDSEYVFDSSYDGLLTPAKISQVLGTNYEDQKQAYIELKKLITPPVVMDTIVGTWSKPVKIEYDPNES